MICTAPTAAPSHIYIAAAHSHTCAAARKAPNSIAKLALGSLDASRVVAALRPNPWVELLDPSLFRDLICTATSVVVVVWVAGWLGVRYCACVCVVVVVGGVIGLSLRMPP